jgi:hypothetical protein
LQLSGAYGKLVGPLEHHACLSARFGTTHLTAPST